jgi:soluble lytic murein transglycosylase
VSPPAASVAARREGSRRELARRRRSAVQRRRRRLKVLGSLALLGVLVVAVLPALERTVRELTLPLAYQDVIREQAAEKHLDPALIAAVIYAETKFDARPSAAGAQGLMQLMPATALYLAKRSGATSFRTSDLATPEVNIAYGSYYLRYLLDHYRGNLVEALAAYNGGIANVDRWVTDAGGRRLSVAQIPFPETRAYVERVLRAQKDYRKTYATELGYR